jgi:hypothetical protein
MKECICKICDKQYSSIQSLCNHNKKFHNKKFTLDVSNATNNVSTTMDKNEPFINNVSTTMAKNEPFINNVSTTIDKSELYVDNKYICKHCTKGFNRRQSKWTHQNKYCKKRHDLPSDLPSDLPCEVPTDLHSDSIKSGDISNVINSNNNNTTNTTTNNTTNNGTINNITINNYKNDNLDYITDNYIKRMFTFLKNENDLHINLPKVIENIKFNPNHKENNNVKITNMRSKVGMKYDNNKWLTVDKDELLNELYKMTIDMLATWAKKDEFLTDEMKMYYARFNAISKCVVNTNIKENINRKAYKLKTKSKEEIHKKAYIYTKNNENILDV